jgi:hypothetical protein
MFQLNWISTRYAVLWDEDMNRGWLANGTSTLLHMLRASLNYYKNHPILEKLLVWDPERMKESKDLYTGDSVLKVLAKEENWSLEVCIEGQDSNGEGITRGGDANPSTQPTRKYIRFNDHVEHFYSPMEKIIDQSDKQDGIPIKAHIW